MKIPITTTIHMDFQDWLKQNHITLSKWIEDHMHQDQIELATGNERHKIDRLVARLDEQCKNNHNLRKRIEQLERMLQKGNSGIL